MKMMKNVVASLILVLFYGVTNAQAPALLNYQGVARNAFGNVIPNQKMTLRLSIRNGSGSGTIAYSETRSITTNAGGLYTVQIGSSGAIKTVGDIASINWQASTKFLQVELDPEGGNNFFDLGTTQLASVPYAMSASTAVPIGTAGGELLGTYPNPSIAAGVITSAKLANGSVTPVKIVDAAVTTAKLADGSVTDSKLVSISGSKVNGNITGNAANVTGTVALANGGTGATTAAEAKTNLGLGNVDNTSDQNKPISTATQAALNLKENSANKSTSTSLGNSDVLYPTQNAVKSYVDASVANANIPDATSLVKGKIQLAGDLTGTAEAPAVAAGAITTAKLNDASVTDAKIVGVSGSKVTGNINGSAANVTGTVAVTNGGTGSTNGSITGTGALTLSAGGTNQNVSLTPTGTGSTILGGNVVIGNSTPDVSAQLDVNSSSKGFLPPRVSLSSTTSASPITSPATGLLVYNIATAGSSPNNVVPGYYYNSGTTSSPVWKRLAPVEVDNTFKLVSTGTALNVNTSQDLVWGSWITLNNSRIQVIVPSGFSTNRIILQWNVWGDVNSTNQAYGSLRFRISQASPTLTTVNSVMMTSWNIVPSGGGQSRWAVPVGYILSDVSAGTYTFDLEVQREVEGGNINSYKMWGVAGNVQVFVR